MGKILEVRNLYKETLNDITKSVDDWKAFLNSASWNFKYSFDDQVLIYAQRPDATACAEMTEWNQKVKRWVNKNAKVIFVKAKDSSEYPYRMVFDVSDTHNYQNTPYKLWQIKKEFEKDIIETLENSFGEIDDKDNLAQAIILSSYNMVMDNMQDYLMSISKYKENSKLENMSNDEIQAIFMSTLWASVSYMMLKRAGFDADKEINNSEFSLISNFNNENLISIIGTATSDIAEMGLREIAKTVIYLKKEERKYNRTLESKKEMDYSNIEKEIEGGENNVKYRIQETRRLYDTKYNVRGGENSNRKVRTNEVEFLKNTEKSRIPNIMERQEVSRTFNADTRTSNNNDKSNYSEISGERWIDRENKTGRTNEMDRLNEQLQDDSGRTSNKGINLHLELLTEKEQMEKIADTDNSVPAIFEFTQEMIDMTLQNGSGFEDGKFRIYKQITSSLSSKDNVEFLKQEYGIGGSSSAYIGANFGQDHNSKGIKLYKGFNENRPEKLLTWNYVEKRIKELILADRYFSSKEFEEYQKWLDKDINENIENINDLEKPVEKILEYRLGDIVYLGSNEFEITNIGTFDIQLNDVKFPLLSREISKDEFEERVKENPANSHLLKIKEETNNNQEIQKIFDNVIKEIVGEQKYIEKNYEITEERYFHFHTNEEGYYYAIYDKNGVEQDGGLLEYSNDENNNSLMDIRKRLAEFTNIVELTNENLEEVSQEFIDNLEFNNESKKIIEETINTEKINFHISDNALGEGTPKEKFKKNIEAIKLLRNLENENKLATKEEQEVLSQYTGWGGLAKAFDENDSSWSNEYNILKDLLSEEEYKNARASTLTAFYTPPVVIKSIYKTLENLGVKNANILEPSCGVGNFLGLIPETMNQSKMYGIELDSLSGRIAKQLYQKSNIAISGYEKVDLPDSFFDIAVGNVPFGDFKVVDKRYDKNNFLIHDYFFAKTIDKVRPGGIVAFITSKGTLDKENPSVRKYIAQRAELLGAIRLPNNTFSKNAGTEVTSDIIFLQKRENMTDIVPDWVYLDKDENGIVMNKYFVDNPQMILGNMEMKTTQYGLDSTCTPDNNTSLEEQLNYAISNINGEITEFEIEDIDDDDKSIMADPSVKNFSYTIVNDEVYYRENSKMYLQDLPVTTVARIKGMIELRECTRKLIEMQTEDYPEENIKNEQIKLNKLYDNFTKKYGLINSRGNSQAFSDDSSYFLLCSLEIMDSDGKFLKKADMFSKRTIKPYKEIKNVSTSNEALIVSMSEKAKVDLDYMSQLTNKDKETIIKELEGYIYEDPIKRGIFYTADEYLSGNIREKLEIAKGMALTHSEFQKNVDSLERVMPEEIGASEIGIKLGSTWIPEDIIQDFIFELLDTPSYITWGMKVRYSKYNSEWYVENKNRDRGNVKANRTYGTDRINAYKIIETTLNLKDVKIFDNIVDENGNKTRVLNKKETAIAQAKQEQIKKEFEDWVWKNPERRNKLVKIYNEKFNSIRPREYDGSNLIFAGMNPEIQLRKHQVNAIAHVLYGGNTLLAHEVGAGKTFEMVASAMESKRLGLCNKSLFVVPNHIIEQFAAEFLQLYPSANILVATKKDFQTANRKKFCSRIATGEYDAVIIGHSQFEKIPMSIERQKAMLEKQINDILKGIDEVKRNKGENFTIKQLEKSRKGLEAKLEKLNNQTNKDDVITFEQLGVDKLFVDEAHNYKNLFLYTKMRNVGGIAQTEAQKSTDLYMKCRYLDEITSGKGVVFATGTPVSNSMVELYTMQRYLQYNTLEKMQLEFFDSWASTFGETVTAIELSPEGTGYRTKTRFAKFHNLPELMSMFKEIADIQTADTLNLPTPNIINKNIVTKPSQLQKEMVEELGNRAEKIRNGMVDASQDNMLKITNEGRKLALDQRLMNDMLEDDPSSKVNECCQNIYNIWNDTKEKKSTQLVFCDLSTPKQFEESVGENGSYKFTDVYNDLRRKLELKGIPKEEIAFIHEADNEVKKKELFGKVRNGEVRVLIGSTSKMGAGTNVQNKLIALHHLDCPWRPADLTQRNGRGVRQGNENENIEIYTYVTEQTFDAYLYQLVENKQKFISQIMTSKTPVRVAEDIDEKALSYGEIKALATGNPYILEKTELDSAVAKIKLLKQSFLSQKYDLQDRIVKYYPNELKRLEEKITAIENDVKYLTEKTCPNTDGFSPMSINGITYTEKSDAGQAIIDVCQKKNNPELETIGEYRGFKMELEYSRFEKEFIIKLTNEYSYSVNLGNDVYGNIQRLDNCLEKIPEKIKLTKEQLENEKVQFENAKIEVEKEFPQEKELQEKQKRLDELNIKLNLNEKDSEILDDGEVEKEEIDVNNKNQYCNKEPVR